MEIPARVGERVLAHAHRDTETGCLISDYSVGSHGYAQIGWNEAGARVVTVAHRVAWISAFGAIPDGMTVDHRCKVRTCVEVAHMRLLTNFENARRTSGRDWPLGQCINGHSNDLLKRWGGKLVCSVCVLDVQRRNRAKKRAA